MARIWTFSKHTESVTSLALAKDGMHMYTGSLDGSILKTNIYNFNTIGYTPPTRDFINDIVLSPDGRFIYSCSNERIVKINTETMKEVSRFEDTSHGTINKLTLNKDGTFIYSIDDSGNVQKVNTSNMTRSSVVNHHQTLNDDAPYGIVFGDDGFVYSCGASHVIKYGPINLTKEVSYNKLGGNGLGHIVYNPRSSGGAVVCLTNTEVVSIDIQNGGATGSDLTINPQGIALVKKDDHIMRCVCRKNENDIILNILDITKLSDFVEYNISNLAGFQVGDVNRIYITDNINEIYMCHTDSSVRRFKFSVGSSGEITGGRLVATYSLSLSTVPSTVIGSEECNVTREGISITDLSNLEEGNYHVNVNKKGYRPIGKDISVGPTTEGQEVRIVLEKFKFKLTIKVKPKGSKVEVANSNNSPITIPKRS